jgi:hypothetical protein
MWAEVNGERKKVAWYVLAFPRTAALRLLSIPRFLFSILVSLTLVSNPKGLGRFLYLQSTSTCTRPVRACPPHSNRHQDRYMRFHGLLP